MSKGSARGLLAKDGILLEAFAIFLCDSSVSLLADTIPVGTGPVFWMVVEAGSFESLEAVFVFFVGGGLGFPAG